MLNQMFHSKRKLLIAVSLVITGSIQPSQADFDQWQINEVFASADGSIQFIELSTSAANQQDLRGQFLVATDGVSQQQNSLVFPSNLIGETANTSVLIATDGFALLTGLTPDFVIDAGFLPLAGGSLNFADGTSTVVYEAGQLPQNGIQSINGQVEPQLASPKSFAAFTADNIQVPIRASVNGETLVLNVPVLDVPGVGLANVSFQVDLQTQEFTLLNNSYFYGPGIVAGDNAAEFQNNLILYLPALLFGTDVFELNLTLLSGEPIVFGNPAIISVTNLVPGPNPEPTPLEQSITRGQSQFASLCSHCHAPDGSGGFGPNLKLSSLNTFLLLSSKINSSMPWGNAGACREDSNSTCPSDIANFIVNVLQQ